MTIIELAITTASVIAIIYIPKQVFKYSKSLIADYHHKRYLARKNEITTLREKAGLKKLLNNSIASRMAYRSYADSCEREGTESVGYEEFYGYTDSKTYIEPSIRARLEELGGLRG